MAPLTEQPGLILGKVGLSSAQAGKGRGVGGSKGHVRDVLVGVRAAASPAPWANIQPCTLALPPGWPIGDGDGPW